MRPKVNKNVDVITQVLKVFNNHNIKNRNVICSSRSDMILNNQKAFISFLFLGN